MTAVLSLVALLVSGPLPGGAGAPGPLLVALPLLPDSASPVGAGEPGRGGIATAARWWRMDAARPGGVLLTGLFRVRIQDGSDTTTVRLTYVLQPAAGATELPVSILRLADGEVSGVTAAWNGRPAGVTFVAGGGSTLHGAIALPGAEPAVPGTLSLTYVVPTHTLADGRFQVPVVAPLWPPAHPENGIFTAEITTAPGLTPSRGYPGPLRTAAGGNGESRYQLTATAVPPMIAFRLTRALPAWFTLAALLAAALLGGILGFLVPSWRRHRRAAV